MAEEKRTSSGGSPANRRRSLRLFLNVPVIVHGTDVQQEPFQEETETLVISAHGSLLLLAKKVFPRQRLRIQNAKTLEEQDCKVTYQGITRASKTEVGVEFTLPNPKFWRVAFPPEDWSMSHPYAKSSGESWKHKLKP